MPGLQYLDLTITVSWSGDFHVQIRTLDEHLTKDQVAALLYPILSDKEKEMAAVNPMIPTPDDTPSPPAAPAPDSPESGS